MESDLFKTNMNLIRGGYYYLLDNTDHSFALLSQLSILPLIWAKFRLVRMHWRHQPFADYSLVSGSHAPQRPVSATFVC